MDWRILVNFILHSGFHDLFLKQRSTKQTQKTKDRATRTPLKTGGELGCSRRIWLFFNS